MHERRKTERRKTDRSRVLKGAKLILEKSMMIHCLVRNLTNIGARLHIPNTVELPEAFGLTFGGGYSVRDCRIVWRTVAETGVAFVRKVGRG